MHPTEYLRTSASDLRLPLAGGSALEPMRENAIGWQMPIFRLKYGTVRSLMIANIPPQGLSVFRQSRSSSCV